MEFHFGKHLARTEKDSVYVQCIGDLTAEDLRDLLDIVDKIIAQHGRYGGIIDARQMGTVHPATRQLLSEWHGSKHCYGNAVFGHGFVLRVTLIMAMRAVQLFTGRSFPVGFFHTESEARAWLRKQSAHGPM